VESPIQPARVAMDLLFFFTKPSFKEGVSWHFFFFSVFKLVSVYEVNPEYGGVRGIPLLIERLCRRWAFTPPRGGSALFFSRFNPDESIFSGTRVQPSPL